MFFNLVENQNHCTKLIHQGSRAEYYKGRNLQNIDRIEFGIEIPYHGYWFSKYIISKYIEKSDKMYYLHLFGIFGRYGNYKFKFISNAIVKNLLHMPITIQQDVRFIWVYIDDFLKVLENFLTDTQNHSVYNITRLIQYYTKILPTINPGIIRTDPYVANSKISLNVNFEVMNDE
jgi:GDP-L-fucose synthase